MQRDKDEVDLFENEDYEPYRGENLNYKFRDIDATTASQTTTGSGATIVSNGSDGALAAQASPLSASAQDKRQQWIRNSTKRKTCLYTEICAHPDADLHKNDPPHADEAHQEKKKRRSDASPSLANPAKAEYRWEGFFVIGSRDRGFVQRRIFIWSFRRARVGVVLGGCRRREFSCVINVSCHRRCRW